MSAEEKETTGTTADLEALIEKDPERPHNGQITNRMLRNLRDPTYQDPATAAAKQSKGAKK